MTADPIVSCAWLAERLDAPDLRLVDATWFMPDDPREGGELYLERRIPGAVFFDIDAIADRETDLPHMLPSPAQFAAKVGALGIGDGARVIVYGANGLASPARVWWSFRAMGHDDVVVLDGGFPAWEAGGYPIETGPRPKPYPRHFTPRYRADLVRDYQAMLRAIEKGAPTILDARPAPRFRGEAPEPRPGLRGGHMPGAVSTPSSAFVTDDGFLKQPDEIEAVLTQAGADVRGSVACTCGSGVTAALIALALARIGRWNASVYDGSWTEWGARADAPVATGD